MSLIASLVIALILTPVFSRVALAVGIVDRPADDGLKIHRDAIPLLGGAAVVVASISISLSEAPPAVPLAIAIAFASGIIDDIRPLPPWVRLAIHTGTAVLLVLGGVQFTPVAALDIPAAIVIVLACVNATNMIDGQDGLAGGSAAIAALGLAVLAWQSGNSWTPILATALAGAAVGFLFYNLPPARIFLGNGGAYAVGLMLAITAGTVGAAGGWRGLLASGACLGVFAFEFVFTMVRRVVSHAGLTTGDRLHSYDLMAERVGRNRATILFWMLGVGAAGLGILISFVPPRVGFAFAALGVFVAAAWGKWLWTHRRAASGRVSTS
jgi:UDP-GlcNAc:undecaprenyl-phosphate/decaprenyl-phosphate GlcNAc-1-phosphate transferase